MSNVEWYAAGGGIARSGPHADQVTAWEAMRYAPDMRRRTGLDHPADTRVWPERVTRRECEICGRRAQEMGTEPRCAEHAQ